MPFLVLAILYNNLKISSNLLIVITCYYDKVRILELLWVVCQKVLM